MHRFYIEPVEQNSKKALISADEAKHAHKVLRLKKADQIIAFDGKGNQYKGVLESINSQSAIMEIQEFEHIEPILPKIILAAAMPKQSKFDAIVDKSTQLGVDLLIPLITERTIVRIDKSKQNDKIIRWQKIAIEAAKQCGCLYVPRIAPIHTFEQIANNAGKYELAVIAALDDAVIPMKDVLKKPKPRDVLVFIGPEGDFSKEEIQFARNRGTVAVSLGKNVLRCETASTMVLSILNYEWKT